MCRSCRRGSPPRSWIAPDVTMFGERLKIKIEVLRALGEGVGDLPVVSAPRIAKYCSLLSWKAGASGNDEADRSDRPL